MRSSFSVSLDRPSPSITTAADASFTTAFGPDSDRHARRAALLKASEHGLDLSRIACRTVELVLSSIREGHSQLNANVGSEFDAYKGVDGRQLELIRSLEWLTFDKATYREALSQANALARFFLCQSLTEKEEIGRAHV